MALGVLTFELSRRSNLFTAAAEEAFRCATLERRENGCRQAMHVREAARKL